MTRLLLFFELFYCTLLGIDRRTPIEKQVDAYRKKAEEKERKKIRVKSTVQPESRNSLKVVR